MLDEGIQLARAILNSNPNAILLVMQPMVGAVAAQSAVMKNRRDLEDKLMAQLDVIMLLQASGRVFLIALLQVSGGSRSLHLVPGAFSRRRSPEAFPTVWLDSLE